MTFSDAVLDNLGFSLPVSDYYDKLKYDQLLSNNNSCPTLMYNIGSIPLNLEKFLMYSGIASNSSNINIMAYCETRLSKDIEHLSSLNGYNLFTNNRNRYGGGVCLHVKRNISCHICVNLCTMSDSTETLFIEATYLGKCVMFRIVYRRPNARIPSFIEIFDKILQDIAATGKKMHFIG